MSNLRSVKVAHLSMQKPICKERHPKRSSNDERRRTSERLRSRPIDGIANREKRTIRDSLRSSQIPTAGAARIPAMWRFRFTIRIRCARYSFDSTPAHIAHAGSCWQAALPADTTVSGHTCPVHGCGFPLTCPLHKDYGKLVRGGHCFGT